MERSAAAGSSPEDPERLRDGWPYFLLWAVASCLAAFALILAPIGGVVVPPLIGVALLIRRSPRVWPEVLGVAPGLGAVGLLVGYFN